MLASKSHFIARQVIRSFRPIHRCVTLPPKRVTQNTLKTLQNVQFDSHSKMSSSNISHADETKKSLESEVKSEKNLAKEAVEALVSEGEAKDSKMTDNKLRSRLDDFQDLFVEARLCIEDCEDSAGTTYFDEEADAARDAVDLACKAYAEIIGDLVREEKKDDNTDLNTRSNEIRRSNGLKVEQLKGELQLVLNGGH